MPLQLANAIITSGQRIYALYDTALSSLDITTRQCVVLMHYAEHHGSNQSAAVACTNIDRSTLSDIVKRLTAKGLIARHRDRHDARAYQVRLTEGGEQVLADARERIQNVNAIAYADIDKSDRKNLVRILAKVAPPMDTSEQSAAA